MAELSSPAVLLDGGAGRVVAGGGGEAFGFAAFHQRATEAAGGIAGPAALQARGPRARAHRDGARGAGICGRYFSGWGGDAGSRPQRGGGRTAEFSRGRGGLAAQDRRAPDARFRPNNGRAAAVDLQRGTALRIAAGTGGAPARHDPGG